MKLIPILITLVSGRNWDDNLPVLSKHQKDQLEKFEDKKIFAKVWAEAGEKLHHDFEKIHSKSHPFSRRHKKRVKKVIYVDEDE